MNNSSRLRSVFILLFGSGLLVQLGLFLGIIFLSRLYHPDAFGEYGFYAGIASVIAVVAGLRFDYLGFSEGGGERSKADFYLVSLLIALIVSAVVFLISVLVKGYFPTRSGFPFWVLFFVFSAALFNLGTQYLLSKGQYKHFSYWRFLQVVIQIGGGAAAYAMFPQHGLSMAFALSQLVIGLGILAFASKDLLVVTAKRLKQCWLDFYRVAAANSAISLLQYSTPFAPVLFGSLVYTKADVGAYFLFSQIFASPLSILRRSLMNFMNAEFASPDKARQVWRANVKHAFKVIALLAAALLVGGGLLVALGQQVVSIALGQAWASYWGLLIPMFFYYMLDAFLQPLTTLLPLWGHHALALRIEAGRFISVFLVLPAIFFLFPASFLTFCAVYFTVMIFFYSLVVVNLYLEVC